MSRRFLPCLAVVLGIVAFDLKAQELGATVQTNSSGAVTNVVFSVWAPNATAVRVSGEFNNWATNSPTLSSNSATKIWTGLVANARPGQAYKYIITTTNNQTLWRKDPRARQVRTLTGGVPAYVTSGSSQQASVIYNPNAFDWSGDFFVPPEPKDIVMYELHVGTFYDPTPNDGQPATFDDAIQKLDYLKGLGVNMIALMPVQEFNGRHSWGYNPSDPFAIEETYGGPDAFKRFVKAAHLMDMAVQVDVVHNHYGDLAQNTNSWTSLKTSDLENFDGGEPYFYNQADETGTNARPGISKTKWGPRPRYIDPNVRAYILDNIRMYLDEYKVWALRWDSPRNITGYQANPGSAVIGDPNAQIPEAIAMMTDIHAEIRNPSRTNSSRYYSIAEDAFNPNDPAPVLGGYHAHWEISYHDAFFSRLLATNAPLPPPFNLKYTNGPATMDTIKFRVENKEDPGFRVTFLENHDKCGDHNSATDGKRLAHDFDTHNPTSLNAQRKTMMAAAATLASAGTPMLWMGQEQLADGDFNDKKALDWSRAAQFPGIVRFHRDMIHLRNTLPALKAAGTNANQTPFALVVTNNQTNGLLAFRRHDGISANNDVLVAMNFSDTTNALPANARSGGFTNAILNSHTTNYAAGLTNIGPMPGSVVSASSNVTIGPWSVLIFARANVPLPANDTNGNGIDDGTDLLTGSRAALPGSFNNWDTNSLVMKWDDVSKTYRYIARFAAPGVQSFRVLTTNWFPPTNQPAFSFTNTNVATWEIRFAPSNGLAQISNLGTNDTPDAWKSFHFGANASSPSADSDGDGWSNLQEFQRSSDPTLHEETRFGVVGHLNGWTWADAASVSSPFQMRYVGHGLWKFFRWFPIGTADFSFKISQGPTENDPNWGPNSNPTNGFAEFTGSRNFGWLTNLEAWQVLTFNERSGAYSIEGFATNSRDTDGDSMPDDWEMFSGLDSLAQVDAFGDADGDSVRNDLEFRRGSSARDPSDHFASMSIPASAFPGSPVKENESPWNPSDPRVAMKWNTNDARWHGLRYVPGPQALRFKFAANQTWSKAWNWKGTNDVPGVALTDGATNDIIHQFTQPGYYIVTFDEHAGRYSFTNMPAADTGNANGLADYWEWFHGGTNATVSPDGDLDGDAVLNKFEFARGSDPRNASDHYAVLALPGDTLPFSARSGWTDRSDSRLRMVWRTNTGLWEFLRFVPRPGSYQVRAANSPFGDSDWAGTTGNHTLNFTSRGHYIIQFEEFAKTYTPLPMPTNDADKNGLADYWQTYLSQPNAAADTDGDGVTALGEYLRGSDPNAKDKSSVMHVHGHVSDWNFTNAVPMRWNSSFGIWEALVWTRQTNESPQRAKFVSVTNPTAAWANSNWGDGFTNRIPPISPDGVADRDGNDIAYTLPSLPFHMLFEFDEVWGDYFAGPISTNDTNSDGLPDDWAVYHGVSNAGGNPDSDNWLNISEYRRGSSPTNIDGDSKRMSVSGDTPSLPSWNPAADNMIWSDQRLRWEWSGTFASSKTVSFRFAPGAWDRWPNMSTSVTGGVRYLIHFDDITGEYGVISHPIWLDWLKSNNLDTSTPRNPWPLDSDGDGIANFQEYALGGNPNLRDRTALPITILTNIAGSNHLVLRWFERTNKDSSLNINPQLSTNLSFASWSSLSDSVITNADTNGIPPGHMRKEVSVPMQGSGSFLRLKIQGP